MSRKELNILSAEINEAVHSNGPLGKTTALGLNALLQSLAAEITAPPVPGSSVVVEQDLSSGSYEAVPSVAAVGTALALAAADEHTQTPYLFQVGTFATEDVSPPEAPHVAKLSIAQAKYLVENLGAVVDIYTDQINGHVHTVNVGYDQNKSEFVVNYVTALQSEVAHGAWLVGHGRDSAALEFVFEAGFTDAVTRTMGPRQAATYQSEQQQNVANASYQLNGTAASLPLTVAAGDVLRIAITRNDPGVGAVVSLLS
jgi:hypothetical protein